MTELFASGLVVDLILALMVLEGVGLVAFHRATGRGVAPLDVLANMLAGLGLLLALRVALTGGSWHWIAASLGAALLAHLADLWRRWRRSA